MLEAVMVAFHLNSAAALPSFSMSYSLLGLPKLTRDGTCSLNTSSEARFHYLSNQLPWISEWERTPPRPSHQAAKCVGASSLGGIVAISFSGPPLAEPFCAALKHAGEWEHCFRGRHAEAWNRDVWLGGRNTLGIFSFFLYNYFWMLRNAIMPIDLPIAHPLNTQRRKAALNFLGREPDSSFRCGFPPASPLNIDAVFFAFPSCLLNMPW